VPDNERALTPEGKRLFARAAEGLARLVSKPDALLVSPLRRAKQTAEFLEVAWGMEMTLEPTLASGSVEMILAMLDKHPPDASVVLVGHEPTVSVLVARLVGSSEAVTFEPGAAALIEQGRLVWFRR
jgi:phosphohistidine phosphatase